MQLGPDFTLEIGISNIHCEDVRNMRNMKNGFVRFGDDGAFSNALGLNVGDANIIKQQYITMMMYEKL